MTKNRIYLFFLPILIFILSTCGGGGGGKVAGIGGSGSRVVGTIDKFGSIYVNGIKFDIDNAQIELDRQMATTSDLRLGMVVAVDGTINPDGITGVAHTVTFDEALQGPIEAITETVDGSQKIIEVLGIQVRIDAKLAILDGTTYDDIRVGDLVEVSGYYSNNREIDATRIEKIETFSANISLVELKGTVEALDAEQFLINGISVHYHDARFEDMTQNDLANGLRVEAKGTLINNQLSAVEIERTGDLFFGDFNKVVLQGVISNYTNLGSFVVSGQLVDASHAELEIGDLVLADGVKITVEGAIVQGKLIAHEIEKPEYGEDDEEEDDD